MELTKNKLNEINGEFLWMHHKERDEFTHYIYSTNNQLVFNRVKEITSTPFSFVRNFFLKRHDPVSSSHNWFPFLSESGRVLGVIRRFNDHVNVSHFSIMLSKPKNIVKNSTIFYKEKNKKVNFKVINLIENKSSPNPHYLATLLRIR